jgi:phenylacetate-CoA ligase
MTEHYDALETRDPAEREAALFARLPEVLRKAMEAPAYAERLKGTDPASITSRAALARLPVLRKSQLPALHKAAPPFGGFVADKPGSFAACSPRLGRSSNPSAARPIPGAARGPYLRRAFAPATWC